MIHSASVLDDSVAQPSDPRRRTAPIVTPGRGGVLGEEQRIARWLDRLRDGSEAEKIAARRGLAGVFEQRGMIAEAIELLESNIAAGVRGAETLRWLSRLYQAQGDETRSLEAAVRSSQDQSASPGSHFAVTHEATWPSAPIPAFRPLVPYLLLLVALGIAVGGVLWTLSPFTSP